MPMSDFEWAYKLNVFSLFRLTQLAAPHMKAAGGGAVVNISSMAGENKNVRMASYGSSKAAVNHLTRNLAFDLGPMGIRVNAIAPGAIKTDALAKVLTPSIEQAMLKHTPLGRLGEANDIANAALFLCSPASAWVSGQVLTVSGGGVRNWTEQQPCAPDRLVHLSRDARHPFLRDQCNDCRQGKNLSTLGIFICAFATALGGGTLRDIMLGPAAQPFFWVAFPFYIVAIFVVAVAYANLDLLRTAIARRDTLVKETAEAVALPRSAPLVPRRPSRFSRPWSDPALCRCCSSGSSVPSSEPSARPSAASFATSC